MLRKHMTVQSREPQHTDKRQSNDRLPLGFPFLSPATSSEEPERSAASAPGPGSAGQDDAAQPAQGAATQQNGDPRQKRQVSFRRPPVHHRTESLPASRSGSVHMQVTVYQQLPLLMSPCVPFSPCTAYLIRLAR